MNNYDVINKMNNVLRELESINKTTNQLKEDIINFINDVENNIDMSVKETISLDDIKTIRVINKFIKENGNILDKKKQGALFNKLVWCNTRKLSLIKLLRMLNYEFEYIESDKEWKDILINEKIITK